MRQIITFPSSRWRLVPATVRIRADLELAMIPGAIPTFLSLVETTAISDAVSSWLTIYHGSDEPMFVFNLNWAGTEWRVIVSYRIQEESITRAICLDRTANP